MKVCSKWLILSVFIILGSLGDLFGIVLALFWTHFEAVLVIFPEVDGKIKQNAAREGKNMQILPKKNPTKYAIFVQKKPFVGYSGCDLQTLGGRTPALFT